MNNEPNTVRVVLRDGTVRSGPLWTWRPLEGWFSLLEHEDHVDRKAGERILIEDCLTAIDCNERIGPRGETGNVDLLAKAKQEIQDEAERRKRGHDFGDEDYIR